MGVGVGPGSRWVFTTTLLAPLLMVAVGRGVRVGLGVGNGAVAIRIAGVAVTAWFEQAAIKPQLTLAKIIE